MSWKTVSIGDVCDLSTGGTPSRTNSEYFDNGEINWLVSGDINKREIFECDGKITELGYKNSNAKYLPINSVLIALNGQGKTRGSVAILRIKATCNQSLVAINPKNKDDLDTKYLFYCLDSKYEEIRKLTGDSGNDRRGLNMPLIRKIKINVPHLSTQRKIVTKLDAILAEIDKATTAAEANANNAEALFQSYATEVFESKKYDFKLVKFGTTASFVRGPFGGSLKKSIFVEKGYAVYEQQHAIYNQFSDIRYFIDKSKFEEMKRFELKSGDLIMSCSGTMGKIAIVPNNIEQGIINQALLKISPNKNVMSEYIARLLSSKYFQDILTKLSGGAAIQNVPAVSVLKEIEVPVPSIKNQKLMVDIIDVLESNKSIIKNSYKSKSKELTSLKQSILQRAFSGELVKD